MTLSIEQKISSTILICSTFGFHVGAASSRDKSALDGAISRQDAAPTSIYQGYFVRIPKVEL